MQFKRTLLASSALALFAAAGQAHAGDLYLSVLGGANFIEDDAGTTPTTFAIDPDTGFVLGAAIGAPLDNWQKGLRVELEASYRRNDIGGTVGGTSTVLDANLSTFALMANLWYDIDFGSKLRPYLGGGIGWARSQLDGATSGGTTTTTAEQSGFAWQLGAGFNYEVAPDVDVGIGYRYFNAEEFQLFFSGLGVPGPEEESHAVHVNLTVGIN